MQLVTTTSKRASSRERNLWNLCKCGGVAVSSFMNAERSQPFDIAFEAAAQHYVMGGGAPTHRGPAARLSAWVVSCTRRRLQAADERKRYTNVHTYARMSQPGQSLHHA